MADPASYGNPDRDVEQALIALKKGSQLIKYSRKGKPKLCPFRVSPDETNLIWYSHGEERNLRLASVSRIQLGQRTAVFKRYPRPEKDYLSFSLIYKDGDRSLDLICKDQAEVEVWLAGLKSLISTGQRSNRRTRSDIFDLHDGSGSETSLDFAGSLTFGRPSIDLSSDVGFSNMQLRTSGGDGFRISVSSTPSCSSVGSGPDDIESLGDVYIWGEVWCDASLPDGSTTGFPTKNDVLLPKPLESNVVLDVHQIACGVRHVALVTRQGEVFTWGEECGGRLGHGVEKNFGRPQLVEFLAVTNVEFVACGEYHTCAVSTSGDLYTWGDGAHNAGLLGHGTDVSHWIPKRVSGPLEGLQVFSVACGTWHSALSTLNGKLFTFGDGTFGALGHGDRESLPHPREIQSLNGLKTIKVACGVWHTAAIIEVPNQYGANRKLFTWGDGDKNRLGHGNKETYLLPTCVSTLIDYNFNQLACGHTVTVGLTMSGHVFTIGSTAYGQLGNPQADGRLPILVQDRLIGEFVEEIACGAYHIAALTSRSELYTWGSGANGRLGHGDTEDRNKPTLVEALKDRHVKSISCGSSYTASICIHKWVSGADQSVCSGCRQAFGFTRKRHNCYNCGLVHCHACSSRKALKAALAPTPGKPHRVCDACYAKLKKGVEAPNPSTFSRKVTAPARPLDGGLRFDRGEIRSSRILLLPITEPIKYLEIKTAKQGTKADYSIVRASQVPSFLQLKDIAFPSSLSALQNAWKPNYVPNIQQQQPPPPPQPPVPSARSVSPYSRRPSPPRSDAPQFSRGVIDSLKKTNELLNQEVSKLQSQVKNLKQKSDLQDSEMKKLQKSAEEAACLAAERSSKCNAAFEVVKCITSELKEMKEKLPPEILDSETFKAMNAQAESLLNNHGAEDLSHEILSDRQYFLQKSASVLNAANNSQFRNMDDGSSGQDTTHNAYGTSQQSTENSSSRTLSRCEGAKEMIEQFEPGVYVTVLQFPSGTKIFKRVRFSKRRFAEQQAEEWWKENKDRLLKKYAPTGRQSGSSQGENKRNSNSSPAAPPVAAEDNREATPPPS